MPKSRTVAPKVPRSRYVTVDGLRFHYLDWPSDGPVLVCLHGAAGSAKQWEPLAAALHPAMRIIALDQRGYGDSDTPPSGYEFRTMAQDLLGFVDALKLERFNLLGHSMGSRVSIVFAGECSDRLERLVLSDPPHYPVEDRILRELAELQTRPKVFASRTDARAYLRGSTPNVAFSDSEWESEIDKRLITQPDSTLTWGWDNGGILQAMAFMLGYVPLSLPKITCPTLVLHGVRSHLLSADDARRVAATIPNAKLVDIDAGHGIWRDNPEAGRQAVKGFLLGS